MVKKTRTSKRLRASATAYRRLAMKLNTPHRTAMRYLDKAEKLGRRATREEERSTREEEREG